MKLRHLALLLTPLLIGVAFYSTRRYSQELTAALGLAPVLECPDTLELGERELGEAALARFQISNRGGGQLEITDIRSSCSCAGLEQERDGELVRVKSLRLAAGESQDLLMRVLVQGTPGIPSRTGIVFRTNDPRHPEMLVEASVSKIKAGVTTVPTSVVFGKVNVGELSSQVLEVYDSANISRTVARVESRNGERVSVRRLPVAANDNVPDPKLGARIARFEVTALTGSPGPLTNELEIYLQDEKRPPTVIEVSGRVADPVEVSPTVLVLPRVLDAKPIYFGECICQSSDGREFTLQVDPPPRGLTVEIGDDGSGPGKASSRQSVRVKWDPTTEIERPPIGLPKVRLRANIDGSEAILEIGVFAHGKGGWQ